MDKIKIEIPSAQILTAADFDPASYVLTEQLKTTIEVAITLQQPLLLTGEPGTGKTKLAYRIAHDLHESDPTFRAKPWVFQTKTSSTAKDLFYQYDALRHFHDANVAKAAAQSAPQIRNYIELQALGAAIAQTHPAEASGYAQGPAQSSVVLIDEIDKAPRDFPNDLLSEVEHFAFHIHEDHNLQIRKATDQRIIMILTSNSEKNLPAAFLRRCVFFHIPFPGETQLLEIARSQLGEQSRYADKQLINHFQKLRTIARKKTAATAELISWLRILQLHQFLDKPLDFTQLSEQQQKILKLSYPILAKDREDLERIEKHLMQLNQVEN
ncbi:MAG: MoxR family ATPase [Bacteroidota bacterium]